MTEKQWSEAWRLLGYIEGANDAGVSEVGHDVIQDAVNALEEILREIVPEGRKK